MEICKQQCQTGTRCLFYDACQQGDIESVKTLIKNYSWDTILRASFLSGRKEIIDFVLSKQDLSEDLLEQVIDDWNPALYGACQCGHMDLVKFAISKGATDWNQGLSEAAFGNHMEIVQFMINCGATKLECGLWGASSGGSSLELVEYIISKGTAQSADFWNTRHWNFALSRAFLGRHMHLVHFFIIKGSQGVSAGISWPEHKKEISELLYLGARVRSFYIRRVTDLELEIKNVQLAIKKRNVLLPELLKLVSSYVIL